MNLKKKTTEFLKDNPQIQEALRLFQISEEQYKKALRSLQPGIFTSDTVNTTPESQKQWMSQKTLGEVS